MVTNPFMTLETSLRERIVSGKPDLVADLYLYPTKAGGKTKPIQLGYGCPCSASKDTSEAWDGYPLLNGEMMPGERRQVGFVFLSGLDAVDALASGDSFYLWEGRFIGEARIVR